MHRWLVRRACRPHSRHTRSLSCAAGSAAFPFDNLMNAIKPTDKKSSVIVVEDHPVLCVGVGDDISGAKRLVEECKPDLMVLDLRLKGGDALDFVKTLRVEHPEVKVLVLSQYDELIFAER